MSNPLTDSLDNISQYASEYDRSLTKAIKQMNESLAKLEALRQANAREYGDNNPADPEQAGWDEIHE